MSSMNYICYSSSEVETVIMMISNACRNFSVIVITLQTTSHAMFNRTFPWNSYPLMNLSFIIFYITPLGAVLCSIIPLIKWPWYAYCLKLMEIILFVVPNYYSIYLHSQKFLMDYLYWLLCMIMLAVWNWWKLLFIGMPTRFFNVNGAILFNDISEFLHVLSSLYNFLWTIVLSIVCLSTASVFCTSLWKKSVM